MEDNLKLHRIQYKCSNYIKSLKKLFNGKPLIIRRSGNVFKICIRPSSIRKLNRETDNSQLATNWEQYYDNVVPLKQMTPFVATGKFIEEDKAKSWQERNKPKQKEMIRLCVEGFEHAIEAQKETAHKVLKNQIDNLETNLKKDHSLTMQLLLLIENSYFDYKIPNTPMHGDFMPDNTIMRNGKLFLIDWEFALKSGSIIYDWWYLKFIINKLENYNENTDHFFLFLDEAIDKIDITDDQFDAFGHAMYSINILSIILSRRKTLNVQDNINTIRKIISKDVMFRM